MDLNRLSVRSISRTPGPVVQPGMLSSYEAEERPVRIHPEKNRKAAGSNPARSTRNDYD